MRLRGGGDDIDDQFTELICEYEGCRAKPKFRFIQTGRLYCGIHKNKIKNDMNNAIEARVETCVAIKPDERVCGKLSKGVFMGLPYCGNHLRHARNDFEKMQAMMERFGVSPSGDGASSSNAPPPYVAPVEERVVVAGTPVVQPDIDE